MKATGLTNLHIIGLTGSFGSGCSYIANNVLAPMGYQVVRLSDVLRAEYEAAGKGDGQAASRRELQAFGDESREKHGAAYFAVLAHQKILAQSEDGTAAKWIVDSIRNPEEVHFLREKSSSFFLFGVYATKERRWQRVQTVYDGNRKEFDEDDERDTGRDSEKSGQRVEDCFAEADVVFSNDEDYEAVGNQPFQDLKGKVASYVDLVSAPLSRRRPTQTECLMATAYTVSQRSSCLQRKVGAVIVDDDGNVISSGFNEVPRYERPCEKQYGKCFRAKERERLQALLQEGYEGSPQKLRSLLDRVQREFRMLDHCRALHAEENAIVNLARNGCSIPLERCDLYTTTYPCRLCANKIANLRIKRVVYLEPYPDQEAKKILKQGEVDDQFFEGITFKAYSRIYGEKR